MKTSNECWMKGYCKKYKKPNCECRFGDVYCEKLYRLDMLYKNSLMTNAQRIPIQMQVNPNSKDAAGINTLINICAGAKEFVQGGDNLYIHSPYCGNGKTTWALNIANEYLTQTWMELIPDRCAVLFVDVPRFFLELKKGIGGKSDYADFIEENALNANLVIWDEIGTKSLSGFEHEHLFSIINARLNAKKSNIYTSNLDEWSVRNLIGERLYSRVVNNSIPIMFTEMDKRGVF